MRSAHASLLGLVALIGSLHAATLRAQSARGIQFGVIGGVSMSSMIGNDAATDLESHVGAMAGVSLVTRSARRLALEVDGLYVAKGLKSSGESSSFDLGAGYIEVPMLLRVQFLRGSSVQPFLSFGPSLGVRVSCSVSVTAGSASTSTSCDELFGSGATIANTDFSGVFGGGVEFAAQAALVTVGARYSRGFTSAIDDQDNHFKVIGLYLGLARAQRK